MSISNYQKKKKLQYTLNDKNIHTKKNSYNFIFSTKKKKSLNFFSWKRLMQFLVWKRKHYKLHDNLIEYVYIYIYIYI
jgi:hypothetical protein